MDIQRMRILLIGLPTSYCYIVPTLESEGHDVLYYDGMADYLYLTSGSQEVHAKVETLIEEFQPTHIINGVPKLVIPEGDYMCLGNTAESARFETDKGYARSQALDLGWKLPPLLADCLNTEINELPNQTLYVKPKNDTTDRTTFKIPAGTPRSDVVSLSPYEVLVEASQAYDVEVWAYFTIADGQFSINRTIGVTGYGNDKLIGSAGDWRDFTAVDLTEEQDTKYRELCSSILSVLATKGGNFEGNVGGCIDSDLDCYFFEINCRPETHNTNTLPSTATNWVQSLIDSPSLADGHITAAQLQAKIQG